MTYNGYTITAEVITERAIYNLDDDGNISDWEQEIDSEPEITYYGILDSDGEYQNWTDTLEEAKQYIDKELKR